MTKQYRHIGTQPVYVGTTEILPGQEFTATDEQVAFFLVIGAAELTPAPASAAPVVVPGSVRFTAQKDED